MKRLAYKTFSPLPSAPTSSVHLVVMHGLLGCYRNWHGVCTSLSTCSSSSASSGALSTGDNITAKAYPCVAFDWRNHGDSAHIEDHSLDTMADDLAEFLMDYADKIDGGTRKSQIPLVLMGHSMGGAALMNFLWSNHVQHVDTSLDSKNSRPIVSSPTEFVNSRYKIVGCIVVDIGPAPRPDSFHRMVDAVGFLPQLPLSQCATLKDAEEWLIHNGPQPMFSRDNIWMIKYFLSNVDHRSKPMKWKIGLDEIVEGTKKILWKFDNSSPASSGGQVYPPISSIPTCFIFGGESPYYNKTSVGAIPHYFARSRIEVIPGGSHFAFLENKSAFCDITRRFLCDVEKELSCVADSGAQLRSSL